MAARLSPAAAGGAVWLLALLAGCGPQPPSEAPSDRAAWHARLRWTEECEQARREDPAAQGPGVQLHPLGGERYLVQVECAQGAYQASYNYVLYDPRTPPGRATLLRFPTFDGERWTLEADVAGLPTFHPGARELEIFSKARGIGDCGQLMRYGFAGGEPRLLWLRARDCPPDPDNRPAPPPGEWPLVPPESIPGLRPGG